MLSKYSGVVVPMISPFTPTGAVDEPAVGRVVERLLSGGVAGIFPLGTTGESASIPTAEKRRIVEATAREVAGRSMVYAGISSNIINESISLAHAFADLGVDALVAHVPSYYTLSGEEIEAYFLRLADAIRLPLVLYNIPQTTHMNIPLDVVMRLSRHPNIVAIKDSANDADRLTQLLARTGGRGGFPVLLGCSAQFSHGLRAGGVGLIPSGAHLVPLEYQQMFDAAMDDNWDEVDRLQRLTDDACRAYLAGRSIGQGLAALKSILESQNICGRTMLPPLLDAPAYVPEMQTA
jgi:dihydrodipicolinate synthase/N-acetylneuraminate lyase